MSQTFKIRHQRTMTRPTHSLFAVVHQHNRYRYGPTMILMTALKTRKLSWQSARE
jgi:hypothetical protein